MHTHARTWDEKKSAAQIYKLILTLLSPPIQTDMINRQVKCYLKNNIQDKQEDFQNGGRSGPLFEKVC